MELTLFGPKASGDFAARVASALGIELAAHEERDFEDGEHKCRPLVNVRGRDVYVVQSLYGEDGRSVNDKLVRLLLFLGALKDASCARLTAVLPYLCYTRKDRRTKPRDPVSTRYVASLLESLGVDRVVTMDVHNLAAYQNAFRIPAEHLEAQQLFVEHLAARVAGESVSVVSPDVGGTKRADAFRLALEQRLARPVASAFVEKRRSEGVVSGDALVGDVDARHVVIVDDLIASGTTLARAARACRESGARWVCAAASHGLFSQEANVALTEPAIDSLLVTDTVVPLRLRAPAVLEKLTVLDAAPLVADAIRRCHIGESIVELLQP